MVVGEGFEPSKAMPTDLQSVPVGHLGIPPTGPKLAAPAKPVNTYHRLRATFQSLFKKRLAQTGQVG